MIIRTQDEPAFDSPEPLWVPIVSYVVFVVVYATFLTVLHWDTITAMKASVLILGATWILLRTAGLHFHTRNK